MPLIHVDQLVPLMVLAADVRDRTGRLLAAKGMVLTEQHFLVFRTWGIKEINILEEGKSATIQEPNSSKQVDQEHLENVIKELSPRFQLNDLGHPVIKKLLRLAAYKQVISHEP